MSFLKTIQPLDISTMSNPDADITFGYGYTLRSLRDTMKIIHSKIINKDDTMFLSALDEEK